MKRKNTLIALLIAFNIVFILIILNYKLKYEIGSFGTEAFIHAKQEQENYEFHWPSNKKMAISLTFDDARESQIDNGIPLLEKYCIKATFYVSLDNFLKRSEDWKSAFKHGHEIGNHTSSHPCSENHDWGLNNSLENYNESMMLNDLKSANKLIFKTIGSKPISFAYPCGQTFIGKGIETKSYVPVIASMFHSGRLTSGGSVNAVYSDFAKLPSQNTDNITFHEIKNIIEDAKKKGKWLILNGHEIGDGISLQTTSLNTLDSICKYASDTTNGIWIDNVENISAFIREKRQEPPFKYITNYRTPESSLYSKMNSIIYINRMRVSNYLNKTRQKLG